MFDLIAHIFIFLHRDISDPGAIIHVCTVKDSAGFTATVQLERISTVLAAWGTVEGKYSGVMWYL